MNPVLAIFLFAFVAALDFACIGLFASLADYSESEREKMGELKYGTIGVALVFGIILFTLLSFYVFFRKVVGL